MPFKLFAQSLVGAALLTSLPVQATLLVDSGVSAEEPIEKGISACKTSCALTLADAHFTGNMKQQAPSDGDLSYFCECDSIVPEIAQSAAKTNQSMRNFAQKLKL